jgi:hypothetical protein
MIGIYVMKCRTARCPKVHLRKTPAVAIVEMKEMNKEEKEWH